MLCENRYYIDFGEAVDGNVIVRQYDLDDNYFNGLPQDEITAGVLKAEVVLRPMCGRFRLDLRIDGKVQTVCDRCLDPVTLPVSLETGMDIVFSENESEDEGTVTLPFGSQGINLAWYMYEAILLSLPMQRVHADGECNVEMSGLLGVYGADENPGGETDPRWKELEEIL